MFPEEGNQLWKRNAISAGTKLLHRCSEDNPFAVGQHFVNKRSPSREPISLDFKDRRPTAVQNMARHGKASYTASSVLTSHTKQNCGNHGTSWNVFGILPVGTSPKTSYQAKLNQARTFSF